VVDEPEEEHGPCDKQQEGGFWGASWQRVVRSREYREKSSENSAGNPSLKMTISDWILV